MVLLSSFIKKLSGKKNTYKLALAIWYFKKLISLFYKNYLIKPIIIFITINTTLLMAKLIIRLMIKSTKKKQGHLVNNTNK